MSSEFSQFLNGTGLSFGSIGSLFTTQFLQVCKGGLIDPLAEKYFPKHKFLKYFEDPNTPDEKEPLWGLVIREILIWVIIVSALYIIYALFFSSSEQSIPPEILEQLISQQSSKGM